MNDTATKTTDKLTNERAQEMLHSLLQDLEQRGFTIDETLSFFAWMNDMMLTGVAVNSADEFAKAGGDKLNAPKVGLVTIERYRRLMEKVCGQVQVRYINGMAMLGLKVVVDESGVIEVTDVRGKEN